MPTLIPAPEYRRCPATGRWVIIAPERSLRPMTLTHAEPHHRNGDTNHACPFCTGQESETPNEVDSIRTESGWQVRVVPNKFPAVRPKPDVLPHSVQTNGFYEKVLAFGMHEVVIDCPHHETNPARLSTEQFGWLLEIFRRRMIAHAENPDFQYAMVFKNVGAEAGASIAHSHSQIITMPIVPDAIRAEFDASQDYYAQYHRCVYCQMIQQEAEIADRIVARNDRFIAICPYAPRFAYEIWVMPVEHESRFEQICTEDFPELAELLRRVLTRLDVVLDKPAYNMLLHTGPLRSRQLPDYHWHWEIIPQTARAAGFEWGSGCFINAVSPERAAQLLRG